MREKFTTIVTIYAYLKKNIGSANQIVFTFRENDDLKIDEEARKEKRVM